MTVRRAVSLTGGGKKKPAAEAEWIMTLGGADAVMGGEIRSRNRVISSVECADSLMMMNAFPRSSLITDMSRLMPLQLMGNPGFSSRATHPPPRLQSDVAALNALRSVGTRRSPATGSHNISCSGFPLLFPNLRTEVPVPFLCINSTSHMKYPPTDFLRCTYSAAH